MTTPDGSQRQQRRSIRLQGYDYTQEGAYFLTVCAHNRACLFGDVIAGEMRLNDAGRLVQTAWEGLPNHYPRIELDAWVIMPNHVHGIVWIAGSGPVRAASVGAGLKPAPTTVAATKRYGLSEIVRGFKRSLPGA